MEHNSLHLLDTDITEAITVEAVSNRRARSEYSEVFESF